MIYQDVWKWQLEHTPYVEKTTLNYFGRAQNEYEMIPM